MDVFSRQESISLLRGRVPTLSEHDAERLAEALEDLPLAIQQAAAFLVETSSTVEKYLELLTSRATEILAHGAPVAYRTSLAASYQVAFDRLAIDVPAALDLLTVAAYLAPEPIPFTLFTAHADLLPDPLATDAGDPLAFASLTRALHQRALAKISTDGMQLHRLVQAILLSRQTGGATRDFIAAGALQLLRQTAPVDPWDNPATWPAWRQLLPHVLAFASRDPESAGEDVAWLLTCAAAYLQTRGSPGLARPVSERALTLHRRLRGDNHPATWDAANILAQVLHELGEYQQARQLNQDTLTRKRRVLGDDHPHTLNSANNLAYNLGVLGAHEQARQLSEDTWARCRRVLGDDHPHTLTSASKLARDLYALGEYQQARQLDEDILARRRRVLGDDHLVTLGSASNLALDLHALGEHEQARQLEEYVRTHRKG